MIESLFFFSFQQMIYGIGWLVGSKLIPEIKKTAVWLSLFALLSALYFLLSPKPSEIISTWHLIVNQAVAVFAFVSIRRANEILFFQAGSRYEDIIFIAILTFVSIGVVGDLLPQKAILIGSSMIILWNGFRIVKMSLFPLLQEFGHAVAVFVITPITLFLVIKGIQTLALFFGYSWIISADNGALLNTTYVGFLLVVTGLLHVGYVVVLLKRLILNLEYLSNVDKLTNIFNRRAAEEIMKNQILVAQQQNRALSVLMVDIDFFKKVNDRYGHAQGDELLRKIADTLKNSIRTNDFVARFGGEEFLMVLPDLSLEKAGELAERIRGNISEEILDPDANPVTVSIGVAQVSSDDENFEKVIARADTALYRAKEQGRDQIYFQR